MNRTVAHRAGIVLYRIFLYLNLKSMLAPLPEDCMGCLNSSYLLIPLYFLHSFPAIHDYFFHDVWGTGPICWEPLKSAGAKDARNNSYFRSLSVDLSYGTFWNPFVLIAFSFDSGPLWLWVSFPVLPILASCFILDIKNNMGWSPLVLLIPAQVLIFVLSGNPFGRNQTVMFVVGHS